MNKTIKIRKLEIDEVKFNYSKVLVPLEEKKTCLSQD